MAQVDQWEIRLRLCIQLWCDSHIRWKHCNNSVQYNVILNITRRLSTSLCISIRVINTETDRQTAGLWRAWWDDAVLWLVDFSALCRQPVLDSSGDPVKFQFSSDRATVTLTGRTHLDVALVRHQL